MLEMKLTESGGEWYLSIDGEGDLDGEMHILIILTTEEVNQLKDLVTGWSLRD